MENYGTHIMVAVVALLIALLLDLYHAFQWWRFLKGKISVVEQSSGFIICFGATLLSPFLILLYFGAIGRTEPEHTWPALLAAPEIMLWAVLLTRPLRLLHERIFIAVQSAPERLQEAARAESIARQLLKRGPF